MSREQKYLIAACVVFLASIIYSVISHVHLWREKNTLLHTIEAVKSQSAKSDRKNDSPQMSSGVDSGDTHRTIPPRENVQETHQSSSPSTTPLASEGETDLITVDLAQAQMELRDWCDVFLKQFPDAPVAPVAKAVSDTYQEMIHLIIVENERLRQRGVPTKVRQKQLHQFAEKTVQDVAKQNRSEELGMKLLRDHTKWSVKLNDYLHKNLPPFPAYLFGLEGNRYHPDHHRYHPD